MSTESLNNLSDRELHNKLIQNGFPNTPVTETTRNILIKKLKNHIKSEKLKRRKSSNYVYYSKDLQDTPFDYAPSPGKPTHNYGHLDNNNDFKISTNSNKYSNLDSSHYTLPASTSRMYAPPLVSTSDYDNDCEPLNTSNTYHKICPIACPMDTSNSYVNINGMPNTSDGGVVNRLLSFRDTTIQRKFNSKGAYVTQASRDSLRNGNTTRFKLSDWKFSFKKPEFNQYIIPQVLIATLVIFLAIITTVYVAKRFDLSPLDETIVKYKICKQDDGNFSLSSYDNCISNEMLKSALYIIEMLLKQLNDLAWQHHCKNANLSPTLELSDFLKSLNSNSNMQVGNLQSKLSAAKYLIKQNPQWMIQMTNDPTAVQRYANALEPLSFELIQPNLPLNCIVLKKMRKFFTIIGALIIIVLSCLAIYYLLNYYRAKKRKHLFVVEQFTKDIINELMYLSSQSENAEITINELKKKLLPSNKLSEMLPAWNKAIKQLQDNDHRILFGVVVRNGEQLRTMSWSEKVEQKDVAQSKKWQSPAFDNSNKIANPPTPCLKIRHMFDSTEVNHPNLRQSILEAIFEKVGLRCKIVDVQLDTQSCCVYLRCASEADAGIVHNEMNGWWFDKRLISIKFLRLERYLSRFPKPSAEPIYYIGSNIMNSHTRT